MDPITLHIVSWIISGLAVLIAYASFKSKNNEKKQDKDNELHDKCNKRHLQHTVDIAILKTQVFYGKEELVKLEEKLDAIKDELREIN